MAASTDNNPQHFKGYVPPASYAARPSMLAPYLMHGHAQALHATSLYPALQVNNGPDRLAVLAHHFGSMNLAPSAPSSMKVNHSTASSEYGGVPMPQGNQAMYLGGQQQVMFAGNHSLHGHASNLAGGAHGNGMNGLPQTPSAYNAMNHMLQAGYTGYHQGLLNGSPYGSNMANVNWTPRAASSEVPTLYTPRRDSLSSNENESPNTPFANYMYGGYQNAAPVAVVDRSPSAAYSGTPSPSQLAGPYSVPLMKMQQPNAAVSPEILALVKQAPAIPPAIPAPSSPLKPLDRSLENKNGETNVYIRGLQPETTDGMLYSWGCRFGDIQSSKSIIDMKTNLCKGFGFIRYHNFEDAEKCIRGFHSLGYEVSFARESFYAKLKKFSDESNTNLYVSNIPRNFNEHELASIFHPFKVCSAKVLRDPNGNGRGVGFARFDTRDTCEEVIKQFNNAPASKRGQEEYLIQIRYADTHEQKMLKQSTAAARQFRAAEFEYGVSLRGMTPGMTPWSSRQGSIEPTGSETTTTYNHDYRQGGVPLGIDTQRVSYTAQTVPYVPATAGSVYSSENTPIPQVNLPTVAKVEDVSTLKIDSNASDNSLVIVHGDNTPPVTPAVSDQE